MLKPQNRLRKKKDFDNVLKRGKGFYGSRISVKLAKNKLKSSRFAFVVSTKVSKSAVKRNRLRRQLREIIRLRLDQIKPGYDVVIMARPASLGLKFEELTKELVKRFKKASLL
jgi:ribonuclease P protein component